MDDRAIIVDRLSKLYRIGGPVSQHETLRDKIARAFRKRTETERDHWALRDVSFEVKRGDVVGFIGRNGAGKSTLLKVLSRITEPTSGKALIRGRVGSLLEVGTGFHPELTGRENIYLNGAILGMKKSEIERRFDEIVSFSEVEKFVDTPVKWYSSGMYLRLAFAVAAHLEPEILIVDEVLAVGDAQFQKKCLGKMGEVANAGRTVLFVSHNMAAIQMLTRYCVVLSAGRVHFIGDSETAIDLYSKGAASDRDAEYLLESKPRSFSGLAQTVEFTKLRLTGMVAGHFESGSPIMVEAQLKSREAVESVRLSFTIFRADGTPVGSGFSAPCGKMESGGRSTFLLTIANHNLSPGNYYMGLACGTGNHREGYRDFDIVLDVCYFQMLPEEGDERTIAHWATNWGSIHFDSISLKPLG